MTFGVSPHYIDELIIDDLTPGQILVIALETAKKLKWNIGDPHQSGFLAYTNMSWSSWSEEIAVAIKDNRITIKSTSTGSPLVDWGKNKKNIALFLNAFQQTRTGFSHEEMAIRIQELNTQHELSRELEPQPIKQSTSGFKSFLGIFIPTEGYFITPILLDLNILVFVIMVSSGVSVMLPDNESLIQWGANFRPVTLDGQWWRLLTSCFVHIGIFHLLMNGYALVYIGMLLEPRLGSTRFLSAYLITGLAASLASLYWHDLTISAGASGAIFGMYGLFLAMLTTNLIEKSARNALITSIAIFVGYNLVNGLKEGIDNAAHIGGLVSGMIAGYAFYPSLNDPDDERTSSYTAIALLSITLFVITFMMFRNSTNDIVEYEAKMEKFVSLESLALEVYQMNRNAPKEELLTEIKSRGLFYWTEIINLLDEVDKLNIPEALHEKNHRLREYCELRIKSYQLLYKTIEEGTDQYETEMKAYNAKIKSIIDELTAKK